jgi:hypothetical protein
LDSTEPPGLPKDMLYTITCAIIGKYVSFDIKIDETEPVKTLKEAIKDKRKNALASYDADDLELYQIDINSRDETTCLEAMKQFTKDLSSHKPLYPERDLSEVYKKPPPKKTIHILVCPPGTVSDTCVGGPGATADTVAPSRKSVPLQDG